MRLSGSRCVDTIVYPASDVTPERVVEIRGAETALGEVLADIRQRIADGERSPVLARHMTALGLDDVLLALARGS